jgi:hypothetical protein
MKRISVLIVAVCSLTISPLLAQDESRDEAAAERSTWTKELKDREQRGKLQDAFQMVRGDSGRWSEEHQVQLAPAMARKSDKVSLDDWFDQLQRIDFTPSSADDTWLLLRTKQLDDNDRVWVERIERRGNQLTVTVSLAKWQGRYQKNFTYYNVYGVNLGKLEPGKYEAKWIIMPLVFREFEGNGRPRENSPTDGRPRDNWSKDETPAEAEPEVLPIGFTVAK